MDKRKSDRIKKSVTIRFFNGKKYFSGTIIDISEKGMFIDSDDCVPSDRNITVIIREGDELFTEDSTIRHLKHKNGCFDGMGVEIVKPTKRYLDFVNSLRSG